MRFEVRHLTTYRYSHPASEAYVETRLHPPILPWQSVQQHELSFHPPAPVSYYEDFNGNTVGFYSMIQRHDRLVVESRAVVETHSRSRPEEALATSIGDARQIYHSALPAVYSYLQAGDVVQLGGECQLWARELFPPNALLGEALLRLNEKIYSHFTYDAGATDISTATPTVWRSRRGVCQDFAHVMLGVLRTAGIPSRYVCGYIESSASSEGEEKQPRLVGSIATHAWVEVLVPGMAWVALDPTNNCWCDEQHVTVAYGADYREAAPVRGTFKGAGRQRMRVSVKMHRIRKATATHNTAAPELPQTNRLTPLSA